MARIQDPEFAVRLGTAIVARRRWLDLSQAELATRMGISASQMGKYENGQNVPDALALVRLCTALGTTPNILLDHQGSRQGAQAHFADLAELLADTPISEVVNAMRHMSTEHRAHVAAIVKTYRGIES